MAKIYAAVLKMGNILKQAQFSKAAEDEERNWCKDYPHKKDEITKGVLTTRLYIKCEI